MITQTIEMTQKVSSESYQLIKDEQLTSVVISSQMLAGSCILKSTYRQVVFSDCVFYACDFKGVSFDNCVFENCRFEFSHFRECHFKNCNFSDCNWMSSSSLNATYDGCELDHEQLEMLSKNENQILSKHHLDYTTDIYIELMAA